MPISKVCVVCGTEFSVPPVREKTAMFCGKTCKAKHASMKYMKERVACTCQFCGKEFSLSTSRVERGNGKFCSKQCKDKALVGRSFTPKAQDGVEVRHGCGYVLERCQDHPFNVNGYVMQHRLVIERQMRQEASGHPFLVMVDGIEYLRRGIEVHHVNEIKDDNRIGNLIACTSAGHKDLHAGKAPMLSECWPVQKVVVDDEPRYKVVDCQRCGKTFKVKLSTWKIRGAKFCSTKCASGYDGDLPSIVYNKCATCGQEYSVKRNAFLNGSKYCSNQCKNIGNKRKI